MSSKAKSKKPVSVLFFQYGDFGTALRRLEADEPETYLDQKRSIEHVVAMACDRSVTVAAPTDTEPYDRTEGNLRCIGISRENFHSDAAVAELVEKTRPRAIILRTPHLGMLRAAILQNIPVFCCLADHFRPVRLHEMFSRAGLGRLRYNRRIARALRARCITVCGNHGMAASLSLRDVLGVPPEFIVPWEWTQLAVSGPLRLSGSAGAPRVVYVGALTSPKGVPELVSALLILASEGINFEADIFGSGEEHESLAQKAANLSQVTFRGTAPRASVQRAMETADVVVVPSRHDYPEGMPNVIFEALAARAPLVISDHPSFFGRLGQGAAVRRFRAGDAADLAQALRPLLADPSQRAEMSAAAEATLASLYFGVSWYEAVDSFVADPTNSEGWVGRYSLARRLAEKDWSRQSQIGHDAA